MFLLQNNYNNNNDEEEEEEEKDLPTTVIPDTKIGFSPPSSSLLSSMFHLRSIQKHDRDCVQKLHEDWFPVKYSNEFYDALTDKNKSFGNTPSSSLWSQVMILSNNNKNNNKNKYNNYNLKKSIESHDLENNNNNIININTIAKEEEEEIIGCIIGATLPVKPNIIGEELDTGLSNSIQSLLIENPQKHQTMFYIMTLGVQTSYRKQGLGKIMVKEAIKHATKIKKKENNSTNRTSTGMNSTNSCGVIYLHVITYNHKAIQFYEQLGFERIKEIQDYYTINNVKYNCFLYAKFINGNFQHKKDNKMNTTTTTTSATATNLVYSFVTNIVYGIWKTFSEPLWSFIDYTDETTNTNNNNDESYPNHCQDDDNFELL